MAHTSFENPIDDLREGDLPSKKGSDAPLLTDDRVLKESGLDGNGFSISEINNQHGQELTEQYIASGMMGDAVLVGANFNPQTGKIEPDYLLVPAWGYESHNGEVLIASNTDGTEHKRIKESDPSYNPEVLTREIMAVAEHLGQSQTRWRKDHVPLGPKCNIYTDAVMKASGLPRPWAETGPALSQDMDVMLGNDPRYDKPWSTDYTNKMTSLKNWSYFEPQPGDILIWNTPDHLVHSGIADGRGGIYSAGSDAPSGFNHTKIQYFTGTVDAPMDYGSPTSVYRYINQKH